MVSHALRHEPWLYGLELDSYGWVRLIDLVVNLQRHRNEWGKIGENDILKMKLWKPFQSLSMHGR